MSWQQLDITTEPEHAEALADLLHECGALSVSFKDAGDQPLFQLTPEETPLWSHTQLIALFSQDQDLQTVIKTLREQPPFAILDCKISHLEEQDWVRQTQKNFPPQCFSEKLWIIPSWCNHAHYNSPKIIIDPGLAFGTGTHPTTALCLKWLAAHAPKNLTVMDYGSGSGILALAALALGAKRVYAVDHDPQALEATQNNATLNHFRPNALHVCLPEDVPTLKANLIIANILSQPLIELAPKISALAHRNATLLLSGLLTTEIDAIATAYASRFKVASASVKEEWAAVVLTAK